MSARVRAAVGLSAVALLGVSFLVTPARAATPAGLPRTAWFDKTYAGPVPPPSPTSGPGQLFVEGADPGTVTKTAGTDPTPAGTGALAVSTLHWTLPAGADADNLVLKIVGTVPPSGVTIEACPTTSTWVAGDQQMGSTVPGYDCTTRASVGYYDSTAGTVSFTDIARTTRNGAIDVALVPGMADRVVLAAPTASSLTVIPGSPDATTPDASTGPDAGAPAGGGYQPPGSGLAGTGQSQGAQTGTPASTVPGGTVPGQTDVGAATPPALAGSDPTAGGAPPAGATGTGATTSPLLATAAAARPLGSSVARPAAVAGLVLALAFFAQLLAGERRRRSTEAEPAGLGRFRTLRDGPAPTL